MRLRRDQLKLTPCLMNQWGGDHPMTSLRLQPAGRPTLGGHLRRRPARTAIRLASWPAAFRGGRLRSPLGQPHRPTASAVATIPQPSVTGIDVADPSQRVAWPCRSSPTRPTSPTRSSPSWSTLRTSSSARSRTRPSAPKSRCSPKPGSSNGTAAGGDRGLPVQRLPGRPHRRRSRTTSTPRPMTDRSGTSARTSSTSPMGRSWTRMARGTRASTGRRR